MIESLGGAFDIHRWRMVFSWCYVIFSIFATNESTRWWFQKYVLFLPLPGGMIQFDEHIFQLD